MKDLGHNPPVPYEKYHEEEDLPQEFGTPQAEEQVESDSQGNGGNVFAERPGEVPDVDDRSDGTVMEV